MLFQLSKTRKSRMQGKLFIVRRESGIMVGEIFTFGCCVVIGAVVVIIALILYLIFRKPKVVVQQYNPPPQYYPQPQPPQEPQYIPPTQPQQPPDLREPVEQPSGQASCPYCRAELQWNRFKGKWYCPDCMKFV